MSYAEFTRWVDYRNRRGSFYVGNRLESGFALIAWLISRAAGGQSEMVDFMPHADAPEATIDDVVKAFGGVRRG